MASDRRSGEDRRANWKAATTQLHFQHLWNTLLDDLDDLVQRWRDNAPVDDRTFDVSEIGDCADELTQVLHKHRP